jgi:hypothetical protein
MANALYGLAREKYLGGTGQLNFATDDVRAMLVRGYTLGANIDTHQFESDVTGAGGTIVSSTAAFASKTVALGVADAADTVFSAVASGAACPYVIIKKHTGTASTSNLIVYIDTATGLPVTPNGGDINLVFDNGANRIFKL